MSGATLTPNHYYLDYHSIQDFCDEIEGNDLQLERVPVDKQILITLNSIKINFDSRYGRILRERVYTYVPHELCEFYSKFKNKPLLTERDYHIIEQLKKGEIVDATDFEPFHYETKTNSFQLFIKYDMTYQNMSKFTNDLNWLLDARGCTFEIAIQLTDNISYLSKFKKELPQYLKENSAKYLDYRRRRETISYVEKHYREFLDFIVSNDKYFKHFICSHFKNFTSHLVQNYQFCSEYRNCLFKNIYKCPEFDVVLERTELPVSYLLNDARFYTDAKYLAYIVRRLNLNSNSCDRIGDDATDDEATADEATDDDANSSDDSDSSDGSDSSDDSDSSDGKLNQKSKESVLSEHERKKCLEFLLEDNSINIKTAEYSEDFKTTFDKFFYENLEILLTFNRSLTLKKIICLGYTDLYGLEKPEVDLGGGYTMPMYYLKIFKTAPPFTLRHDPLISHTTITIGKVEKPYTLNEVWKRYVGDISIPAWIKSQKGYKEMCLKKQANINGLTTIGDAQFLILYQNATDLANNLPYYKLALCADVGRKVKSQYCKSARVFLTSLCTKDNYDQIVTLLDSKYHHNRTKTIFTGQITQISQDIINHLNLSNLGSVLLGPDSTGTSTVSASGGPGTSVSLNGSDIILE